MCETIFTRMILTLLQEVQFDLQSGHQSRRGAQEAHHDRPPKSGPDDVLSQAKTWPLSASKHGNLVNSDVGSGVHALQTNPLVISAKKNGSGIEFNILFGPWPWKLLCPKNSNSGVSVH
ncbi:hypothetical protein Pst134EB_025074 [Puccinia striiformis f. sp. tritici]|nr:hypothetical protein Pst134EB_025074 [Puccinia striiformis f. sp. tritici]